MFRYTLSFKEVTNNGSSSNQAVLLAKMIFTTIQSKFREITSELFKDRGNNGDVPCPVGEARVFALAKAPEMKEVYAFSILSDMINSRDEDNEMPITQDVDMSPIKGYESPIPPPQIGVNFKQNNNKEEIVNEMSVLGFSKITSGKNNYYLGSASRPALKRISQLGGDVDSFTAPQHSNIRGYMCFQFIAFLLFNFCMLPEHIADFIVPSSMNPEEGEVTEGKVSSMVINGLVSRNAIVKTTSKISKGHFLPYFNGMNTPDKHTLPRILLAYFGPFFVTESARTTLTKGFASLASTSVGIQLSHLAYVVERAIILKGQTRVFLTGGSIYSGVVLESEGPLFKGNARIEAKTGEEIKEELAGFDAHDAALAAVCATLSSMAIKTADSGLLDKKETVLPAEITSPRQLHNLCRERNFDTAAIKEFTPLVNKLSFTQTYWNSTDVSCIQRAILAISNRDFLPADCPMPYKTSGILFTKDIYTSTLSAFGDRVPTLSSRGETVLILSNKSETMFTRPQAARLPGFPLYETRLSAATETWRDMFKGGVLHMACNEKGKTLNIKGVKAVISKDTDSGISLSRTLAQHVALKSQDNREKKRVRDVIDEDEEERIKKKRDAKEKQKAESIFDDFFA